jgi:hypothetical protein
MRNDLVMKVIAIDSPAQLTKALVLFIKFGIKQTYLTLF